MKHQARKSIGVLPSVLTLGNLLCGFGAIAYASAGVEGDPHRYGKAAWLVLVAMIFDALDGRIARLAKLTSRFGAELDSLADVVTFGVAPALLVKGAAAHLLHPRLLWPLCALYVACTALRLARFNVQSTAEAKSHLGFSGLPSPAAAGVIASLFILHEYLGKPEVRIFGLLVPENPLGDLLLRALPFAMVALGTLMISRLAYPHLLSRVLGGRRPFAHFVELLFVGILAAIETELIIAVGFVFFAAFGPISFVVRRVREARAASQPGRELRQYPR